MELETKNLELEWDAVVQGLAAVGLQLECADASLAAPENTEDARKAVRKALSLTRSNLQKTLDLSR